MLATKDNLYRRRCAGTRLCPICQKYPEIVEHLLFGYEWVRAVWFGSDLKFNIDGGPNLSVLKWSSDLLNRSESSKEWESFISLIVWIGWFIWKDRNNFVFNHIVVEPLSTLIRA